jgi:amidohydrolase
LANEIKEQIAGMRNWLVEIRRTIHSHPELGFEEVETSRLVSEWLERFGIEVKRGVAKTGVVGLLRGGAPGKTVAIRADMDALPMDEATGVPYASKIKGKMHACGHDAHVTILLGVARFFSSMRDKVKGNIKWIFQPGEEGFGGGKLMVEAGILEDPKVDAIFAAHVFPFLRTGQVGITEGKAMASSDKFTLRVIGKGGHGAYPHVTHDPILAAGHIITQIQSIVSRNVNPLDSAVVSFGAVHGGRAYNVIPDDVELTGTVRSLNPEVREELKSRIEQITRGVVVSLGLDYHYEFEYGYPVLINDAWMSKLVVSTCSKAIGKDNVEILQPSMGAEDFAYYLEKCPGAIFRLGVRNEKKGLIQPHHNTLFNIDEDVLPFGVEMFVRVIDEFLGNKEKG